MNERNILPLLQIPNHLTQNSLMFLLWTCLSTNYLIMLKFFILHCDSYCFLVTASEVKLNLIVTHWGWIHHQICCKLWLYTHRLFTIILNLFKDVFKEEASFNYTFDPSHMEGHFCVPTMVPLATPNAS